MKNLMQKQLKEYNKCRSQFESNFELPQRQIHLRRLAKQLISKVQLLYRYPTLVYLEDCSKHMLLSEP